MFMLPLFAELVVVCFCCHCLLSWLWSVSVALFAELAVVCFCCQCLLIWLLSVYVAIVC